VTIPGQASELYQFIPLVPDGIERSTGEITIRYPIDPHVAANAPVDIPYTAKSARDMAAELAPYVAQARASWPAARARYLAGLPPRQAFFVTVELRDAKHRTERVFVAVDEIADGTVSGRIWNDIELVEGYSFRQSITVPESEVLDWTIARPDGSEEGNFIGKYLDSHRSGTAK
jgi:hypothetical protein